MTETKPGDEQEVSFEDALERLQEIVEKLESGELGLAESLEQFATASKHWRQNSCGPSPESLITSISLYRILERYA